MLTHRRGWRFDVPDAAQGTVQVFERRLGRRLPHSGASDTAGAADGRPRVHRWAPGRRPAAGHRRARSGQ
jgi:hypothetical protein